MAEKQLAAKKERIYYWDNIKGFLIIMVVIGHLLPLYRDEFPVLNNVWSLIYAFHMPMFIFINGYFIKKSSKPMTVGCTKMFGYYLLMQVVFALFLSMYELVFNHNFTFELSLTMPRHTCWYMLFMAYAYILTLWMKKCSSKHWIPAVLGISLLAGFDATIGSQMAVSRLIYFLPFLSLGYYIDTDSIVEKLKSKKIIFAVVAIAVLAVVWLADGLPVFSRSVYMGNDPYVELFKDNLLLGLANRIFAYAVGFVLIMCILVLMTKKKSFLSVIGRHTLVIYLTHYLIIEAMSKVLPKIKFFGNAALNALAVCVIISAVIAAVSAAIIIISKRIKTSKN